jgi:hypothetical protein
VYYLKMQLALLGETPILSWSDAEALQVVGMVVPQKATSWK